jgi:hypothetical protein
MNLLEESDHRWWYDDSAAEPCEHCGMTYKDYSGWAQLGQIRKCPKVDRRIEIDGVIVTGPPS